MVALGAPQRKCREPVAEVDDAADVRALLTRMRRDVLAQAVDLALGEWREDYTHKISLLLGRGAAHLDAPEDRRRPAGYRLEAYSTLVSIASSDIRKVS